MGRLYAPVRTWRVIVFLMVGLLWNLYHNSPTCFSATPSYEMQTTPANGVVTIERQPTLQWLVFPNGNQINEAKLSLDGQSVPVQQVAAGTAVALRYQPTVDLAVGSHTMEYVLTIAGFRSITVTSSFVITDRGPDLYSGKDRLKLANMEAEAITALNAYRQTLGLTVLVKNEKLSMGAQAHANYQTLNNVAGHYERQGTPGFTGVIPQNRGEFFGYTGLVGEGISFDEPVDSMGVDGLMDAPYHRLGHVNPNYREVGIAFGWGPDSTVVDYGSAGVNNDDRVMLYPYPNQNDAKIAWFVAEDPNPLARYGKDKVTVGYPISMSVHDDKTVELKTVTAALTDDGGRNVPFYLVDSSQETEHKCHVFLIPVEPLLAGKTYTVAVNGIRVQKDGSTIPVNRTWSFTTRPELAIRHIGVTTLDNDEYVEVVTKNGDLPDLNYTLSRDGNRIRGYVGQEREYYSYDRAPLENGEYSLEIDSKLFSQTLNYKVVISGEKGDRRVTIVN